MISIARPLLGREEEEAVLNVLRSGVLASSSKVKEFEERFAEYVGVKYAVATSSGTTALHLALLSLGIGKGDEVIVPSFSFIATANAILFCGAKPVFCDIDPKTYNIDTDKIEKLITNRTKAILPVHLYGQPADLKPIMEIAEKYDLYVIGDAAQAHGAEYDGKKIGSFGDVECFSFYPTKNMTTGEGGMITTNSKDIAERARSLGNHGREKTQWGYEHMRLGYNYRMTDMEAAIGIEQLKKLDRFNDARIKNARFYDEELEEVEGIVTPYVMENAKHVYHQYTIRVKRKKREKLIEIFKKKGIGYGIYYPKPLHFYPHLRKFAHDDLKNSENVADEVISIPVHSGLREEDLALVVDVIKEGMR